MLLLGIDVGTSSIKVTILDAQSGIAVSSAQYPETEAAIQSPQPGWAEQQPEMWWNNFCTAFKIATSKESFNPKDIAAIGIAYQMHGLVMVDKNLEVLRPAIIWCDSRSIEIGEKAFHSIGQAKCLANLLNSPGNFTAAKLAWVKENEPEIYEKAYKIMLPGDYMAMRFTGEITTSISALSEGIFWDFVHNCLSKDVLEHFGFSETLIPDIKDLFTSHGQLSTSVAQLLGLTPGIPVSYKAGDQPNNALSLNVLEPGEVGATAGTSGVIYAVSDALSFDPQSRVNAFAHVNHTSQKLRIGTLLCINGTGISNSFTRKMFSPNKTYTQLNEEAAKIKPGSNGLLVLPFGNGAERMLGNKTVSSHFSNIDFNLHTPAHFFRAVQEGIVYSFRYGLDVMRDNGIQPSVIRAGNANMFLSPIFSHAFVNTLNTAVELYNNDGSTGAAIGAGIGAGIFTQKEAFANINPIKTIEPEQNKPFEEHYQIWLKLLQTHLKA